MIECEATAKKWGNSIGIILPKDVLEKGEIKENDTIRVLLIKENQTAKKMFGMFKGKMSVDAQKLKDKWRRELYND